jgi:hypothetical protein
MTIQEAMKKAVEEGYHLNGSDGMDTDDAGANRACSAWTRKETESTCVSSVGKHHGSIRTFGGH